MQQTFPSSKIWAKLINDFDNQISKSKPQIDQQSSLYFEIDHPLMLFSQLQNAIAMLNQRSGEHIISLLISQLPKLLFVLEQNISTMITIQILDLIILLQEWKIGQTNLILIQNLGEKILLDRIQDSNIDVVNRVGKILLKKFILIFLIQMNADNILIMVSEKLKNNNVFSMEISSLLWQVCKLSKNPEIHTKGLLHIVQLKQLPSQLLINILNEYLSANKFQILLSQHLIEYDFIDWLFQTAYLENVFKLLQILVSNTNCQQYFLKYNILKVYEYPLKPYFENAFQYSNSLTIISNGCQQITNNLFGFKEIDPIIQLVSLSNNVIRLKLSFELKYIISKGILFKYFHLLSNQTVDKITILSLEGLFEILKLGNRYIDEQFNTLYKLVRKLNSKENSELSGWIKNVLSEINRQKQYR